MWFPWKRSPVVDFALESQDGPTFDVGIDDVDPSLFGLESWAGSSVIAPRISRREAMQVSAVKRSRDLICGTIGSLPLELRDQDFNISKPELLEQPEDYQPRSVTMTELLEDMLFEKRAYWRITQRNSRGYPVKVRRLDPGSVDDQGNQVTYTRPDGRPQGIGPEVIQDVDLIKFYSPNDALLDSGARAIRTARQLASSAALHADTPAMQGYFSPAEGADPASDEDVQDILDQWQAARKARVTGYVPASLTFHPTTMSAKDMELTEVMKGAVLEIARHTGIDPEDLGVSTTSRTYQNGESRRLFFLQYTLLPYMKAVEERLSMSDVTPRGYTVSFNTTEFMRTDMSTRYDAWKTGLEIGAITKEEIRKEDQRPALPISEQTDGKVAPTPNTNLRVISGGSVPQAITASQFSDDEPLHFGFETSETKNAFEVDREKRTIYGLAVPYGPVAKKGGRKFRFNQKSLAFSSPVSRTKMLNQHDRKTAFGKLVEYNNSPEGLWVKFSIARGPEGDKALSMAEDEIWDGLSVGLGEGGQYQTDPDGAIVPVGVPLSEVSLTPNPAFDDARVAAVAASADERIATMPCTTCGQNHAAGTPCATVPTPTPPAFDQDALINAIVARMQTPAAPAPAGPTPVPGGPVPVFQVTEAPMYRFDGGKGQFDFSTDLIAASKGDMEAKARAEKFTAEQFDVDRADATNLNPTRQRPDMYVDQREYLYPLWTAVNKGTLADSTPFTFPKFNSSSGLVADHTEGTEPTPGTFTATGQTVTPTAVSGKVEITREAWDQGGNPQLSGLIWRQMTRAYYEALEAGVAATFTAAAGSITDIALTAGGGTDGQTAAAEIEAAFVALQYIRGGFRFDTFATQIDLFKTLAAAKDDSGRPLYPILNPQNANGQSQPQFRTMSVAGVTAIPTWALAATGSVSANSWLFDRDAVHGWATAPRRLQFEYRVAYVDLAVWGYKAFAISDYSGVRQVTYDPVP